MKNYDITAVICTYNRSGLLPGAIQRMMAQEVGDLRYELIVVDNNSSDDTRQVVESFISQGHANVRYVFEPKQGLSHARNTAVANARSPIVAFTDDDIRVEPDWLASVVRAFRAHPDVNFVGGKVLPVWPHDPPAWLNKDHWAPLAIVDYGDDAFLLDSHRSPTMVGANLSVRTKVFSDVGLFLPKFQRVKDSIGSTEDHEFQLRLHKAGIHGLYSPDIVVTAAVQTERLTKAYHRRWHAGHGKFCAWMGTEHVQDDSPRLFNVPAYLYRHLGKTGLQWVGAFARLDGAARFRFENELRHTVNYMRTLASQGSVNPRRGAIAEVAAFTNAMVRRKLSTRQRALPPERAR